MDLKAISSKSHKTFYPFKNFIIRTNDTMKNLIFVLFTLLFLNACTHDPKEYDITEYQYNHEFTSFQWTAYKYTDRIGVSGTFEEIEVINTKKASHPIEVIEDLSFTIKTSSLNTNSILKNSNILNFYFASLVNSHEIKGTITGYEGDKFSGAININLIFNGIAKEAKFLYQMQGTLLTVIGDINLGDWQGEKALENMRACCEDYHTGSDGVHLIWPDLSITINTDLSTSPRN